jgi:S1-C subfamily serine protease
LLLVLSQPLTASRIYGLLHFPPRGGFYNVVHRWIGRTAIVLGALVNLKGELVGINTAFIGASNTNPGMGFAIRINMVRDVANHILEFGNTQRANIGMSYQDLNPALLRERRLPSTVSGPVITKIDVGSAAERAGLRIGDVVIELARSQ